MGNFFNALGKDVKRQAQSMVGWARIGLFVVTLAINLIGMYFQVMDVGSSYNGWGLHVAAYLNLPFSNTTKFFAFLITLSVTLWQDIYTLVSIGKLGFKESAGFKISYWIVFFVDSSLDFVSLYTNGWESAIYSFLVVMLLYGVFSEYMFPVTMTLMFSLYGDTIGKIDWWSYPGGDEAPAHQQRSASHRSARKSTGQQSQRTAFFQQHGEE